MFGVGPSLDRERGQVMHKLWVAIIMTLAGTGAALADSPETLPTPRNTKQADTPTTPQAIPTRPGPVVSNVPLTAVAATAK